MLYNTAVGFAIHWHDSATDAHVSPDLNPLPLPSPPISLGCPNTPAFSALLHASNSHWSPVLHKVIHMLQCYSLKSSHPRLLPQIPKICSLHLCLFCCLAYRVIVAIFLNSIHIQYLCFSFWLSSLCRISSHFIHLIRTDSNVFLFIAE